MTWTESRSYCQSISGDLATWGMRNASTRNWIIENVVRPGAYVHYWIGLSDIEQEGIWKYIDGVNATAANTDFADGEPNDSLGDADCARLQRENNYRMDDDNCGQNYRAICERTLN
uniref:C-type lectin domain family 4 member F-like n=1 Tax=Phallusia mammillata TaxID=59560 RepID=A0A6F9DAB0_9ASCI|nr:C-type lectin domain family 4 member F-like [Phallusia mammillata]